MEKLTEDFIVPNYIAEEILEYIEQTAQGKCKGMKWRNIQALLISSNKWENNKRTG